MTKQLYYVGFYDMHDSSENRINSVAAVNKMNYIASTFVEKDFHVNILSASYTLDQKTYKKNTRKIAPKINVTRFFTLGWTNKFYKIISLLNINISIIINLLKNMKKGDKIIVYHSLDLMFTTILIKILFKKSVILELEEVYSEVKKVNSVIKFVEGKVIKINENFILPTKKLAEIVPDYSKFVVVHGIYKQKKITEELSFNDKKIHIVYAGTFDETKGVLDFINAAKYLDKNYELHVLGFGSKKEIENIKNTIEIVNSNSECLVIFEGLKKDKDFDYFLQKCNLGISPQDVNALYNSTSFPSKILTYLSNGLRVLTISVDTIKESDVGKTLYYYHDNDPKCIAEEIRSIDFNILYDSKEILNKLDRKFNLQLNEIIKN